MLPVSVVGPLLGNATLTLGDVIIAEGITEGTVLVTVGVGALRISRVALLVTSQGGEAESFSTLDCSSSFVVHL
jgi:hypothetical protein